MSAYPETRFTCDRCHIDDVMPMAGGPVNEKMAGPKDWLMLRMGSDPTVPPHHLCPHCAEEFQTFLKVYVK